MARYKHYDYNQTKMIPLRFSDQIQPGTFEYTLNHVVDKDLYLSVFESRYRNDYNGSSAYNPAILQKVVLFAYSRGISSRKIAQACRESDPRFAALPRLPIKASVSAPSESNEWTPSELCTE